MHKSSSVLAQERPDQSLEGLRQRGIRNVALVLVELARRKQASRWNKRLLQLVDDCGFADARVPGHEHQLGPAPGDDAIERGEKDVDLRSAPVEFLGDHEAIWSVMIARREIVDAPLRVPFGEAAPEVALDTRRRLVSVLDGLGEHLHGDGGDGDRNARQLLAGVCRLSRNVAVHPLHRVGCRERKTAGQHFIEGDSERVQVASGIDGAVHSSGLLGCHVGERSCDELGRFRRLPLAREARCNAEAGEPDSLRRRIHDHVGRLDVLVYEATSVKPTECGRHGRCQAQKSSDFHGLTDKAIEGDAS